MARYYVTAMTLILIAAALAIAYSDVAWVRRAALILVLALVVGATVVQFRERCPRCGWRLRTKSRLTLPERCRGCGVAFERPPPKD
jgi:hypothetical protein